MCTAAAREAGRNDSVPLLALCRCVPGMSTVDQYGADRWRSTGHRERNGEVSCNQQLPARCFSSWSRSLPSPILRLSCRTCVIDSV